METIFWFFFFKKLFETKSNKRNIAKVNKIKSYIEKNDTDEERDGAAYIFFSIPLLIGFIFLMAKAMNII